MLASRASPYMLHARVRMSCDSGVSMKYDVVRHRPCMECVPTTIGSACARCVPDAMQTESESVVSYAHAHAGVTLALYTKQLSRATGASSLLHLQCKQRATSRPPQEKLATVTTSDAPIKTACCADHASAPLAEIEHTHHQANGSFNLVHFAMGSIGCKMRQCLACSVGLHGSIPIKEAPRQSWLAYRAAWIVLAPHLAQS